MGSSGINASTWGMKVYQPIVPIGKNPQSLKRSEVNHLIKSRKRKQTRDPVHTSSEKGLQRVRRELRGRVSREGETPVSTASLCQISNVESSVKGNTNGLNT